ncbi:hypothetical protein F4861DRAFT_403429 [Xylaria intraflava]|nr:hypothetical protein F4861DRAFT_403429 [Xylaria intraflava]
MLDHRWPEPARKRARDEESESDGAAHSQIGFTEHRNKRLHSAIIPLSPTRCRSGPSDFPLHSSTIPPNSNSDPEEDVETEQLSVMPRMDLDQDVDMSVDHLSSPELLHPNHAAPNGTGRIPTPIHCSFAAQVRGNHWDAMPSADDGGNTGMFPNSNAIASGQLYPPHDPSNPLSRSGITEWSLVQNRRLPSPISENGGEDMAVGAGMALDDCGRLQHHQPPHTPHSSNAQAIPLHPNIRLSPQPADADAAMMDTDGGSPSSAPATPSPRSKYGHCRSKHTINTWTLQPGMKKSFSIGYRADCEKCRMKIPGHFNHIIIS